VGGAANPRILEYLRSCGYTTASDETPWCGAFVGWCMHQCQPPLACPKNSLGQNVAIWAPAWRSWGAQSEPRPGAIAVVQRRDVPVRPAGATSEAHVGMWVAAGPGSVRLLGGNQGDAVCERDFLLRSYSLVALRWPLQPEA
jgi:uncharacterized protein (TIGR02594 family)